MYALGLMQPIVVQSRGETRFRFVAGQHRLEAARSLGWTQIDAKVVVDPTANWATLSEIDENLIRAELSPAETAMHVARRKQLYESLHPETRRGGAPGAGKGQGKASSKGAKTASFVGDTVTKTGKAKRTVERDAARGKVGQEWLGKVVGTSLDKGDEIDALIELPSADRNELIRRAEKGEDVTAKTRVKQVKREAREQELAAKQTALPDQKFGVILADPEWQFEPWSRETGMDRAADNHYPTSALEAIKARDIASISADECVLFLWATAPMLPQALEVMAAWGFRYVTHAVWAKDKAGTGYWLRNQHELLLFGTKGNIPGPAPGTQSSSIIDAPVGRHSEKPESFHELIETYFPTMPKIELNRRGPAHNGWAAWGNESVESETNRERT